MGRVSGVNALLAGWAGQPGPCLPGSSASHYGEWHFLLENLDLLTLARRSFEIALVVLPLRMKGATGSTVARSRSVG